ncbi:MAG: BMP family ABC transporter substrate-binding protein [Ruminococcaceae bacterium]|nr:BMP family ABC transporter substrate-binding protein [Oscillospiraceae bacterium]
MKRFFSIVLALSMILSCFLFASCEKKRDEDDDWDDDTEDVSETEEDEDDKRTREEDSADRYTEEDEETEDKTAFKLGVICLHDEKSTYDKNFIDAVKKVQRELDLEDEQIIFKKNVPESKACYDAAEELVDEGCTVIFANSFGHEPFLLKAAKKYDDVQFCHATGTMAHTEKLPNFHNAYASVYEGRYLTGIAAGMKLKEMMAKDPTVIPKIGFVGSFTYAEVISAYTAFYLGVKEIVPEVTMEVQFTGSWYDEIGEKNVAKNLIENGCAVISQYSDSMGAPAACEEMGVPNVSYNVSNAAACPNTYIVASRIDWAPYLELICEKAMAGDAEDIPTDYVGTLETGSVALTEINESVAASDTEETVEKYEKKLKKGSLEVFDTQSFTVTASDDKNKNAATDANGVLISYMADVDTDSDFEADTEAVSQDGKSFEESKYRSAPYFDLQIDGITLLNAKF